MNMASKLNLAFNYLLRYLNFDFGIFGEKNDEIFLKTAVFSIVVKYNFKKNHCRGNNTNVNFIELKLYIIYDTKFMLDDA